MSSQPDTPEAQARRVRSLMKLRAAVQEFRELDARIPSAYIDAYLAVATKPGLGPTEYGRMLGSLQPIASRVLMEIGDKARERDRGLMLVTRTADLQDGRCLHYHLSPKGRALADRLGRILEGR